MVQCKDRIFHQQGWHRERHICLADCHKKIAPGSIFQVQMMDRLWSLMFLKIKWVWRPWWWNEWKWKNWRKTLTGEREGSRERDKRYQGYLMKPQSILLFYIYINYILYMCISSYLKEIMSLGLKMRHTRTIGYSTTTNQCQAIRSLLWVSVNIVWGTPKTTLLHLLKKPHPGDTTGTNQKDPSVILFP